MKHIGYLLLVLLLIVPAAASPSLDVDSSQEEGISSGNDQARTLLAGGILATLRGEGPGIDLLMDAAQLYPEYPRAITDSADRTVILYRNPSRIIAMNSDAADALSVIGMVESIVGVGHVVVGSPLRFPDLFNLQNVGKYNEPDIEAILALNPDMVVTYGQWPEPEKLDRHLPERITIVRIDLFRAETYRSEMESIAYLLGETRESRAYLAWYDEMHTLVADRIAAIPEEERIRVFIDYGQGRSVGRRTMSAGTGMDSLVVAAGGVNVAADYVSGYADVENEWVMKENPDVILIHSPKAGYVLEEKDVLKEAYQDLVSMPGFGRISAVADDRVYVVTSSFGFGSPSPAALVRVASWLYPDHFSDIDPDAIHQDYLSRFTRSDPLVRTGGAFYYPVD